MTDYWISQKRHFCDFCKCWIADNKPSRDFHERGKKHQQNVQIRISDVMKKGADEARKKEDMSDTLKHMEKAALQALKKDLKADPSLASQYGVRLKPKEATGPEKSEEIATPETISMQGDPSSTKCSLTQNTSSKAKSSNNSTNVNDDWKEEWTPEGFVYYWHVETGESRWEKPEGYTPTWERAVKGKEEAEEEVELEPIVTPAVVTTQVVEKPEQVAEPPPELPPSPITIADIPLPGHDQTPVPASVIPVLQVESEPEPVEEENVPEPGVGPLTHTQATKRASTSAYGAWQSIRPQTDDTPVDLELPASKDSTASEVKVITLHEPKIKFRQKKVDTLGAEFVAFKKRKLASGNRRKTDSEEV